LNWKGIGIIDRGGDRNKGLGEKPLMLLITEPLRRNRQVLRQVGKMYFKRWKIEESIWFVKQGFDLENVRLLRYQGIRNLLVLLLLVFLFLSVALDHNQKYKILYGHILACSKRVFGILVLTFYARSDGIRLIFIRSPLKLPSLDIRNNRQLSFLLNFGGCPGILINS